MSNCSAEDLGLVIMDDCSKQTVLRAECRTAAALMASAHQFFQQRDSELSDRHDDERCSFLWLQYREDATNSSKHRSKMTALELQASYVVAARHDLPSLSSKDLTCIRRLADVLPVHRGDVLQLWPCARRCLKVWAVRPGIHLWNSMRLASCALFASVTS